MKLNEMITMQKQKQQMPAANVPVATALASGVSNPCSFNPAITGLFFLAPSIANSIGHNSPGAITGLADPKLISSLIEMNIRHQQQQQIQQQQQQLELYLKEIFKATAGNGATAVYQPQLQQQLQLNPALHVLSAIQSTDNKHSDAPELNSKDSPSAQAEENDDEKQAEVIETVERQQKNQQEQPYASLRIDYKTKKSKKAAAKKQSKQAADDKTAREELLTHAICQKKFTVGRKIKDETGNEESQADILIENSTFVSRVHFSLELIEPAPGKETTTTDGPYWMLECLSKNGVFVNTQYINAGECVNLNGAAAGERRTCKIRFPNTSIRVYFESLLGVGAASSEKEEDNHHLTESMHHIFDSSSPVSPSQTVSSSIFHSPGRETEQDKASEMPQTDSDCSNQLMIQEEVELKTDTSTVCTKKKQLKRHRSDPESQKKAKKQKTTASVDSDASTADGAGSSHKPAYSYAQLIAQAILSSTEQQLTLSQIYSYIASKYSYYKLNDKGWQNSIRHNLSLNRNFVKVARQQNEPGKGSFWRIEPSSEAKVIEQAFNRKSRSSTPNPEHFNRENLSVVKTELPKSSNTAQSTEDQKTVDPQTVNNAILAAVPLQLVSHQITIPMAMPIQLLTPATSAALSLLQKQQQQIKLPAVPPLLDASNLYRILKINAD